MAPHKGRRASGGNILIARENYHVPGLRANFSSDNQWFNIFYLDVLAVQMIEVGVDGY